jgi:hypothetical protein
MKDIDNRRLSQAQEELGSLTASELKLIQEVTSGRRADYRLRSANAEAKDLNDPDSAAEWGPERTVRAEVVTWLCGTSKFWNPVGGGVIDIRGAKIEGDLRLDNVSIDVVLRFLHCRIQGTIFLRNSTLRTIDLEGTYLSPTKAREADSEKGTWCIKATEANINGSVRLKNGFRAFGMVNFDNSKINGNFQCSAGSFFNREYPAFTAKGAEIVGDLRLDNGFEPNGDVDLRRIKVGARLTIDPASESSNAENTYDLDLRFAQIGMLYHRWNGWPQKGHLLLSGLTYNTLGRQAKEVQQIHDAEWLRMQPKTMFSTQPYEQLATVLRSDGDESAAKKVLIARQDDLCRFGKLSRLHKVWNRFLGVTIKHGYEPQRAFYGMLGFVLLGWIIFGIAEKNDIMSKEVEHKEIAEDEYPRFNAFLYSLDAFLPIVDLKQKGYWLPNARKGSPVFVRPASVIEKEHLESSSTGSEGNSGKRGDDVTWGTMVVGYLVIHIVCGWILTTLWVAGFTGLVRN